MSTFPVVKGERLRATKINSCGQPVAGAQGYLVTSGFVSVQLNAVMRDAQDLEQVNAEGLICVADRTPPVRKWYTPQIELCNVNTGLITMFNGWEQVVDADDMPIGFRDQDTVEVDYGVAIEVWSGGRSDDDCPTPNSDSIFTNPGTGKQYGYFLFGGTEWQLGDINIGAQVSTFTLTGRTIPMPHWGRGPWNVANIGTGGAIEGGRLLAPVGQKEHLTVFRTPIAPPEPTPGSGPCALDIVGRFVDPDFYYGGPGGAAAADVAPAQAICTDVMVTYTVAITGTPTGGGFKFTYEGLETAGTVAFNSAHGPAQTVLEALSNIAVGEVEVTGGPLPGSPLTVKLANGGTLTATSVALTGGTTPAVVVTQV